MPVRIEFDPSHIVESPNIILMTRGGEKIGRIPASNIHFRDCFNSYSEFQFDIYKAACDKRVWEKTKDFKLAYVKEWEDRLFEISLEYNDSEKERKTVKGVSLGEAELSQIKLFDIEINTETDWEISDYRVTVLFDRDHPERSLLHRLSEKIPHYTIKHVDDTIANIQRPFQFNDVTIYDAFQEIAEEIGCIFIFDCYYDHEGIHRDISVYDLESYCNNCHSRGDFISSCDKCGSTDIRHGYGDDTTIFVSKENLADEIVFSTDVESVKNCFRLEGGDDLMTAAIIDCNPSGSQYIWCITDEMKMDMSSGLRSRLKQYQDTYDYYQGKTNITHPEQYTPHGFEDNSRYTVYETTGTYHIGDNVLHNDVFYGCIRYNDEYSIKIPGEIGSENYWEPHTDIISFLARKAYKKCNQMISFCNDWYGHDKCNGFPEDGFPLLPEDDVHSYDKLMEIYYGIVDILIYINDTVTPKSASTETDASIELEKIATYFSEPDVSVAVQKTETCSESVVTNAVLSIVKVIADSTRYQIKANDTTYDASTKEWRGKFVLTSYSDDTDTAESVDFLTININDDLETFARQRIDEAINKKTDGNTDIVSLFKIENEAEFKDAVLLYNFSYIKSLYDACQACLDVLIKQGIADKKSWDEMIESGSVSKNLYTVLYEDYLSKLSYINDCIGQITEIISPMQSAQEELMAEISYINTALKLEDYFTQEQWSEFLSFRREDTYKNENYISDGLNNKQLFDNARDFIATANKEIYKSSNLQHGIKATLKNLLVMREFEPIIKYFKTGNWIRISVDGEIYKLRIVDYEIIYDDLNNIPITFSDVKIAGENIISDLKSIASKAQSMSSSYSYVARQADKGCESKEKLDKIDNEGIALKNSKIVDDINDQNILWDNNGILLREYDYSLGGYSDEQLKIINSGLYVTDDNWSTAKAGIGKFSYYDPDLEHGGANKGMKEGFGVIADTLVSNLILTKNIGIYNTKNSVTIDENGMIITTDGINTGGNDIVFTIQRSYTEGGATAYKQLLTIDENGSLVLNGDVKINSEAYGEVESVDGIMQYSNAQIDISAKEIKSTVGSAVSKYDNVCYDEVLSPDISDIDTYYELIGTVYTETKDTSIDTSKTYYTKTEYTITCFGYGDPESGSYVSDHNGEYYLDQSNGKLYLSDGTAWAYVRTLDTLYITKGDIGTEIIQNSEFIRLAWNETSEYIQFENASLVIYQDDNKKLMSLNNTGCWYFSYDEDNNVSIEIGQIGTSTIVGLGGNNYRGLVFDLENEADYMAWSRKLSPSSPDYTITVAFFAKDIITTDGTKQKGFHVFSDSYLHGDININGSFLVNNSNVSINDVDYPGAIITINGNPYYDATNDTIYRTQLAIGDDFEFSKSKNATLHCFNNIDVHGYDVLNSSDERLKKNIVDTEVCAIDLLNKIELKTYDWIENEKHEDIGIIAQQLRDVLPEIVHEDTHGILSIAMGKFIPYLIKAVQELSKNREM